MKKKLYIGLLIFTILSWGGLNYANYSINTNEQKVMVIENGSFIDEVVNDISIEQQHLESTQMVKDPLNELVGIPKTLDKSKMSVGETPAHFVEIQLEINELEKEKVEYLEEKKTLRMVISKQLGVFNGWDINNPLVNIVILPLLLYFGKKVLDLLFRLFSREIFEGDEVT